MHFDSVVLDQRGSDEQGNKMDNTNQEQRSKSTQVYYVIASHPWKRRYNLILLRILEVVMPPVYRE